MNIQMFNIKRFVGSEPCCVTELAIDVHKLFNQVRSNLAQLPYVARKVGGNNSRLRRKSRESSIGGDDAFQAILRIVIDEREATGGR